MAGEPALTLPDLEGDHVRLRSFSAADLSVVLDLGEAAILTNLGRYQDSKHLHVHVHVHVHSGKQLR